MKYLILALVMGAVAGLSLVGPVAAGQTISSISVSQHRDTTFDQAAALAKLRSELAGKERSPADSVFTNIEIMKGFPVQRLLAVMEFGFSRSLGVECTHCHDPSDWSSELKPEKQIAREMWEMTGRINRELLSGIANLSSETPVVNCTTCHRGQVIPATSLD